MRLLLYTGKGGVGKTTTAAATGLVAAERGHRVLVVSADVAHSLGDVLEAPLGAEPTQLAPRFDALEVDARRVVDAHWGRVKRYLAGVLRHQGIDEVVAEELALLPGAEELATLARVEELAATGAYDLVVVDCAPTGATLRLVSVPELADSSLRWLLRLQRAAAHVVEPLARNLTGVPLPDASVFGEAEQLVFETLAGFRKRLLSSQTSFRLVATPETLALDEAQRALAELCLFELSCDAIVLNRVLPESAAQEPFLSEWVSTQAERRAETRSVFAPMRVLEAPWAEDEVSGLEALAEHGRALFGRADPAAWLGATPRLRFEQDGAGARMRLPLPGDAGRPEVARVDDVLFVEVGGQRRRIALPQGLVRLDVAGVRWRAGELEVSFASAEAGART